MPTVATYNLLHGLDTGRGGALDLEAAAGDIDALGADVVAVQEVDRGLARTHGTHQVDWLADRLGCAGVFAPSLLGDPDSSWRPLGDRDPGGPAYGIGLLSRLPILEWSYHRLPGGGRVPGGGRATRHRTASPSRPGWDREPRVALACVLGDGTRRLAVVTTHLSYLPWRGLRQLRAAARHAGDGPALLVGDLNLTPRAVRLALPGWDGAEGPPTYPAWRPRARVDHILGRGLAVIDVRVGPRGASDHLPVTAEVLDC